MKRVLSVLLLMSSSLAWAVEPDTHYYELRVYDSNEGKQAKVNDLIAKSGVKYMTKHNINLVGAWVPVDSADDRVITLVSHKDKASAAKSWAAFQADDGWKSELADSSKDGKAVKAITQIYLNATDYSPTVKAANVGKRIFEMRTYVSTPNNLKHLNARFRDHTVKLFEKHGMTNVAYFNIPEDEKLTNEQLLKACSVKGKDSADCKMSDPAAPTALVYFLSHQDEAAMKASFGKFGPDPDWKSALANSEKTAGGPLTVKTGVKSIVLKATDYSPMK
jgi:hypothetical protein